MTKEPAGGESLAPMTPCNKLSGVMASVKLKFILVLTPDPPHAPPQKSKRKEGLLTRT